MKNLLPNTTTTANLQSSISPKKKGRPRKIRTPEELAKIEAQQKSKLSLALKLAIKLELQKEKQAKKSNSEPANKERFYCTNKELQEELLNWRNSGTSIYKILKLHGTKLVPTAVDDTIYHHEKYNEGTLYFLLYSETDKRYVNTKKDKKLFSKKSNNMIAENVTEEVKNNGWAFDLDDPVEDRKMTDKLGKMLLDIGNKLLNHSSFRNYGKELKDDMLMFGVEKTIKGLKNYNFRFVNPFAWVTQAFWNAYLSVLNRNYRLINIRKDLMIKLSQELETYTGINPSSGLARCIKSYLGNEVDAEQ